MFKTPRSLLKHTWARNSGLRNFNTSSIFFLGSKLCLNQQHDLIPEKISLISFTDEYSQCVFHWIKSAMRQGMKFKLKYHDVSGLFLNVIARFYWGGKRSTSRQKFCQNTLEFCQISVRILDFVEPNKILSDQTFIKPTVKLCWIVWCYFQSVYSLM